MSIKVKGGMYCPSCGTRVIAQRNGHAVRNTVRAAVTFGLSRKSEPWRCPDCGGPTKPTGTENTTLSQDILSALAVAAWVSIPLLIAGLTGSGMAALVTFVVLIPVVVALIVYLALS